MSSPLAIFAPSIGDRSQTFIQRHMRDLLPDRTVVVTSTLDGPFNGHWSVHCPTLVLDRIHKVGHARRILRAIARRVGWRYGDDPAIVEQWLRKHQVQVVMGEWLDWALPWAPLAQRLGIRFFGHAHGIDVSKQLCDPKWRADYVRYNDASGVITMSQLSRERLVGLGLDPAKVHVVPYGVDVPAQLSARTENDTVNCLAVGRMVAKKAPILTLDAFRRAAEMCPSLRLDYVGEGQLLTAAIQFTRAFDLGDRVTLHGARSNAFVYELMKKADIFLQHSMIDPETGDEEGLPVAILEAMAQALPVVSTRHAGIPEAVVEGETGYLVDEGDSHEMADRLITLSRDPDLRFRMGQAGWCRVKEHFSWEKEKTELLAILGLGR